MERSIVFGPDIPDRELDKEVSKIDDRLKEVDETITPEVDTSGLDGVGTGMGDRGGGGGGIGAGGAAGVGALSRKIPKPVSGVTMGTVMPVALGGAVGVGMLSAMHSASARLQTSTTLLGQAWNNVWRPIGDDVDSLFVRPVAKDILAATESFEETWREGQEFDAIANLLDGIDPAKEIGEALASKLGIDQNILPNFLSGVNWTRVLSAGPAAPGMLITEAFIDKLPSISASQIISALTSGGGGGHDPPGRATTPGHTTRVQSERPLDLDVMSPGERGAKRAARLLVQEGFTSVSPSGLGVPGSGTGTFQRGAVVNERTTGTVAEAGPEVVQPLSEFERLIERVAREASGGGEVDTSGMESKLDRLHRDMQSLARAMSDITLSVDGETFGRAAVNGRDNRVADTNPTV